MLDLGGLYAFVTMLVSLNASLSNTVEALPMLPFGIMRLLYTKDA